MEFMRTKEEFAACHHRNSRSNNAMPAARGRPVFLSASVSKSDFVAAVQSTDATPSRPRSMCRDTSPQPAAISVKNCVTEVCPRAALKRPRMLQSL